MSWSYFIRFFSLRSVITLMNLQFTKGFLDELKRRKTGVHRVKPLGKHVLQPGKVSHRPENGPL